MENGNDDVYGIGNALVDIQARVSDEQLVALGFAKGAMTLVNEADQARVLGTLGGTSVTRCAGGSAANTVMGVNDLGGKTAYAGKTGLDALGEFFLQDMRDRGVKISVQQTSGVTGTCVCLITDDAQRTMLTHLGLSATLGPDDVDEEAVKNAKFIYLEGYSFTQKITQDAFYKATELAKEHGTRVAFTVSDPFLCETFRDEFWQLIEGPVDLLFCNLDEARGLTGTQDAVECAAALHRHSENVALTLGESGSILMHEGVPIPIEGVSTNAVDTTGAGDMYAAGVLFGITNGLSWRQSGHLASHAAARVVSQFGARLDRKFTPEEIAALLR